MRLHVSFLAVLLLSAQAEVHGKVAPLSLSELGRRSDVIVVARVTRIVSNDPLDPQSPRYATATVIQVWKGNPDHTVEFLASPTWACDIADAALQERVLLFLDRDEHRPHGYVIAFAGRGRMPLREVKGKVYVTVWSDVVLPDGIPVIPGPEPKYEFIVSVEVRVIREALGKQGKRPAA